ncbi:hypothetical protein [Streptomyces sp. NPDC058614]|uniref:hypothetical protein n=1 Tax=Streptomyces sp. NPDC058614 TaxID=3346557 RepID=UPI00366781DA
MARNPIQIRWLSGRLGCPADARFTDRRHHGHTLKGCQGFDVSQEALTRELLKRRKEENGPDAAY